MRRNYFIKSISIIFMLLAMLFSCDQLTDEITNNSGNNTTQDGGNNNSGDNNSGNENSGNNQGGENTGGNNDKPAVKVTITFNANGANLTVPQPMNVISGENVYLPVIDDSKFSHWNTETDGSGISYNETAVFTESVTLYAIMLAENEFKIIYKLDGGVNNSANPRSFADNESVTLRIPTRENYVFMGWYEKQDFSGKAITGWNAGDKTTTVTLYACWKQGVYIYDFIIEVTNLPENVKALSLWGSCNDWRLENIEADKDSYIVDVIDGTATFAFDKFDYSSPLKCQFVPMTSRDMELNNSTWWQTAFSGGSYGESEDNFVYDFETVGNKMTLTLDFEETFAEVAVEEIFQDRFHGGMNALQASFRECAYKITYNNIIETDNNPNITSFEKEHNVTLKNASRPGYKFIGWYKTEDFSGNPITGWKAGDKTADVTLYAKWIVEEDPTVTIPVTQVTTYSFPYGFRFCTEEGWECTYISEGAVELDEKADKVMLKVNGDVANITKEAKNKIEIDVLNDDSTKIYVDDYTLASGKLYTLTYDKKNGTVKLTEAAAGAKVTSTATQEANAEGEYPAGMYISGYLGGNWAGDDNAGTALLMDVVDEENEVYAFIWAAPVASVTVTLKITMEDTDSTLYLKDVPVKTDGTSVINGSIYGWNSDMGGAAVTIKNEDGSTITGGIFDAAATATANAEWALKNYVNGNTDVDLAEKFGMPGADDVLQLAIDAEKFVPYVKGQESIFSWSKAQDKLDAPFVN